MGSSSENILRQSFGGVYSNELLAEGGSLYSERAEPFSYISVEVCWDVCVCFIPPYTPACRVMVYLVDCVVRKKGGSIT